MSDRRNPERGGRPAPTTAIGRRLFAGLSDAVAVEEGDPASQPLDLGALFPEERAAVAGAVPHRQREFIAGRVLARRAMHRLEPARPAALSVVGVGTDRAPVWPDGLVGSISHTDRWCIVALAGTGRVRAVGVDVESSEPLTTDLWPAVCTPAERALLQALPVVRRGLTAKLIFSIKECVYKAQYPATRAFLDFDAVSVAFTALLDDRAAWHAKFTAGRRPDGWPDGEIRGHCLIRPPLIATGTVLIRDQRER